MPCDEDARRSDLGPRNGIAVRGPERIYETSGEGVSMKRFALMVAVSLVCWPASAQAWQSAGASVYNGCPGAWGNVCGGAGFAELGAPYGTLMGGLAPGTTVTIRYRGREVVVRKLDWGSGGGPVGGLPRAVDLPCSTAARLGIFDCVSWTGVVRWAVGRPVLRMRGWRTKNAPRERGALTAPGVVCPIGSSRVAARGCVPGRRGGVLRGRAARAGRSDG